MKWLNLERHAQNGCCRSPCLCRTGVAESQHRENGVMGNGDPPRTVRTPGRYRETPSLREHPWVQPAVGAQHLVAMPTFRSESGHSNIQYNMSSSYTGPICPSLGQDMTSQIPASLVQNRSPSLRRWDHEIGDGSPALRIVRQLEVEAESWAVAHHIGQRSQNRGDSS